MPITVYGLAWVTPGEGGAMEWRYTEAARDALVPIWHIQNGDRIKTFMWEVVGPTYDSHVAEMEDAWYSGAIEKFLDIDS